MKPARLWFGFLGGAVAWSLRLLVGYPLVPTVCDLGWTGLLHLVTLLFAAIAAAALLVAWQTTRRAGVGPERAEESERPGRHVRFMAVSGLLLNALFLLAILLEGASALLHDPCIIPITEPPRAGLGVVGGLAGLLAPSPAVAHAGRELTAGAAGWTTLTLDPWVLVPLILTALVYVRGTRVLRRRGRGRAVPGWRVVAFGGALGALIVALVSPLDTLSGELFAAHMVQHLLLMVVAAPLIALAGPLPAVLWGLPRRARLAVGRWWVRARWAQAAWRGLAHPAGVWGLHAVALWAWHLPALYEAALASRAVHALEHATFLVAALLFWWVLVHAGGARGFGYGAAVLYVFASSIQGGALGALITLAPEPWYPAHAVGAARWGLTPLEDQQLAGVIMWAPASLVYVAAALALFRAWLGAAERAAARGDASSPRRDAPLDVRLAARHLSAGERRSPSSF